MVSDWTSVLGGEDEDEVEFEDDFEDLSVLSEELGNVAISPSLAVEAGSVMSAEDASSSIDR